MAASTVEIFNSLWTVFVTLGVLVGVVVISYMAYLVVRNRARPGRPEPEDVPKPGELPREQRGAKKLLISVILSATIVISLILITFTALDVLDRPPADAFEVKVVAFQWGWKFYYPNGYESTGELRIPRGVPVKFYVTSQDVFHNMGIIDLRFKVDAIPGKTNIGWMRVYTTGVYDIRCFELCGDGHGVMIGRLVVMEPEEFESWYSSLTVS
ncbi:MAG: cytochrome c oxidase subunit II [Nitrososphaerota archaeon]|nr:cytochrome c oxidase subunit II [Candidatus Calditenuaceae archaeon]MDW8073717.1 cytochrome c oxidase subunit II [Nitrososphaerota archaeon]